MLLSSVLCPLGALFNKVGIIAGVSPDLPILELKNLVDQAIQEVTVVGNDGHRSGIMEQGILKNVFGFDVQMIGRLIQHQEVGVEQHDF